MREECVHTCVSCQQEHQWLLPVAALMWQFWVACSSRWRRMEQISRAGKHWNISPAACQVSTPKEAARVSVGSDSPSERIALFWKRGIHTHPEAGLGTRLSQLVPLRESQHPECLSCLRDTRITETQRSCPWHSVNLCSRHSLLRGRTKLLDLRDVAEDATEARNCQGMVEEEFPQFTCLYLATKHEHSGRQ